MLVMTLFGLAVLFVLERDPSLAAVQVIVYAGAIAVLFLFVIMFLGVDKEEYIPIEPLRGQRPLAVALVILGHHRAAPTRPGLELGHRGAPRGRRRDRCPIQRRPAGHLGEHHLPVPFEATAALPIIAVVGAVVLARRPPTSANSAADRRPARRRRTPGPGRGDAGPTPGTASAPGPGRCPAGAAASSHRQARSVTIDARRYLALTAVLFAIGALGVLVRRNVLVMFMCVS